MKEFKSEKQKKNENREFSKKISIIIGCASSYLFGYMGSLILSENMSFSTAFNEALNEILKFHLLYPLNSNAILGIMSGVLIAPIIYFLSTLDYDRNSHFEKDAIAGTGGFLEGEEKKEYDKAFIDPGIKTTKESDTNKGESEVKYVDGVIDPITKEINKNASMNMIASEHMLHSINDFFTHQNNNYAVFGGAGTGKSRSIIKPNILQMNASYVVTDPSGELLVSTGKILEENGYKIKIFNLSDMTHSNCYNPLNYIRNEAGVNMMIDCFIKNTGGEDTGGNGKFFVDAERLLYSACIFYLLYHCDDYSKKNMSTVMAMINSSSVDEQNPNAKSPLDAIFEGLPKKSLAWKYYKGFKQAAGRTLKSIIISCITRLQPFMAPQVANLTNIDTIDLSSIGDEKTALFIIVPQADRTYSFLASMMYAQLFEALYYKGEQQKLKTNSERLRYPVRCLMDEFANIGVIPEFPSKVSTMRKYNISVTIVLQDKAQLEAMYEKEWRTLIANCDSIIYLGSSEIDTLKYFSEKLGNMTITQRNSGRSYGGKGGSNLSFQQTKREVMTAEEIGRLPNDECLVFTRGYRPARDKKYDYTKHKLYKYTADGGDAEERAYRYNEIPTYDNSKDIKINSIIKANIESAKFNKSMMVSDPMPAKDVRIKRSDRKGYYRRLQAEQNKEKVIILEKIDSIYSQYQSCKSKPCFISIENAPDDHLRIIAKGVAEKYSIDSIILMNENERMCKFIVIDHSDSELSKAAHNQYCDKLITKKINSLLVSECDVQKKHKYNFITYIENNCKKTKFREKGRYIEEQEIQVK